MASWSFRFRTFRALFLALVSACERSKCSGRLQGGWPPIDIAALAQVQMLGESTVAAGINASALAEAARSQPTPTDECDAG